MKEPSEKRQRTLALHDRAIQFSNSVNLSCPEHFTNIPSSRAWSNLVRAADGTSTNLVEADDASSDADLLNQMSIALREAKESRPSSRFVLGHLYHYRTIAERGLESEAGQLAAIFAAIIRNMKLRLQAEAKRGVTKRR